MLDRQQRTMARKLSEQAKPASSTTALARPAFAFVATALFLAQPAPLSAQQNQAAQNSVCMARPPSDPDSPPFVIKIPTSEQSVMAARGYAIHPCSADVGAFEAYRARMCRLANVEPADTPASVRAQSKPKRNMTPRALCGMAIGPAEA